jgi:hypothetical protein
MPNLSLTEAEAADLVAYVDAQTVSDRGAPGAMKTEPKSK